MSPTPQTIRILNECDMLLARIGTRYGTTIRRLTTDITPGFPTRTPGSGEPGGGHGGHGESATERLAGRNTPELDDLRDALELPAVIAKRTNRLAAGMTIVIANIPHNSPRATLRQLVWSRWLIRQLLEQNRDVSSRRLDNVHHAIVRLDNITNRWGYTPHKPERPTNPRTLADDATGELCRSCLRVGAREPRYRGDLCQWCYRFELTERFLPPTDILETRASGKTITENMVAPHRQAHRDRNKKRRRKAG